MIIALHRGKQKQLKKIKYNKKKKEEGKDSLPKDGNENHD